MQSQSALHTVRYSEVSGNYFIMNVTAVAIASDSDDVTRDRSDRDFVPILFSSQ